MFPQGDYREMFTKDDVGKTCYLDYKTNCLKIGDDNWFRPLLLSKLRKMNS